MSEKLPEPSEGNFLFYQTEDGKTHVRVLIDDGTVWLSQRLIGELYGKNVRTVNEHIGNIYGEGEVDPGATIRKFRIVQTEGDRQVSRLVDLYNLDVILVHPSEACADATCCADASFLETAATREEASYFAG